MNKREGEGVGSFVAGGDSDKRIFLYKIDIFQPTCNKHSAKSETNKKSRLFSTNLFEGSGIFLPSNPSFTK